MGIKQIESLIPFSFIIYTRTRARARARLDKGILKIKI